MRTFTCVAMALLAVGMTLRADVTLESGETLTLNVAGVSPANVSGGTITAKGGSTIKLTPPAGTVGEAGFCMYENSTYPSWPGVGGRVSAMVVSNYLGVVTDIWPANEKVSTNKLTFVYCATWRVPADGVYSFYEDIDDAALIAIDGEIILSNTAYGTATCVQDIVLTAGDHHLLIAFGNSGNGTFGANAPDYAPALCYSASNAMITRQDHADARPFTDPGDGSIFRSALYNTVEFRILPNLLLDGGEVTLDCTETGDSVIPHIYYGILAKNGGSLKITGTTRVDVGAFESAVNFPIFDAPVSFAGSGTIHFNGFVTIPDKLTVPYVIEPDSDLALWGTDTLGAGDITLTTYNLTLLCGTAVNPVATITVGDGRKLTVKYCTRNTNLWNTWSGTSGTLSSPVVLNGENALLHIKANNAINLAGSVTGTGNVLVTDNGSAEKACVFSGPIAFKGQVTIRDAAHVKVYSETFGDPDNAITLNNNANLSFFPGGPDNTEPTSVTIGSITANSSDNTRLRIAANQTIHVGTLSGALGSVGVKGETSHVMIDTVTDNATLAIFHETSATLDEVGENVTVICRSYNGPGAKIALTASRADCPVSLVTVEANTIADFVGDALAVEGPGTLRVTADARLYRVSASTDVTVAPNARLEFGNKTVLDSVLGDLPALWLDPSKEETMQQYNYNTYYATSTNGIIIRRWNDCRPGQTGLYALQPRGEGYLRVYPYTITNALNGKTVVSFGKQGGSIPAAWGHVSATGVPDSGNNQSETRRIILNKPVTAATAVMVFGSQFGGGYSVLGGYTLSGEGKDVRGNESPWTNGSTPGVLKRGNGSASDPATPILLNDRPVWLDGLSVKATQSGFSGDYQVLSMNPNAAVRSLGWYDAVGNSGGQIYGEVLIYTNVLTRVERSAVECYLAAKWAIPGYPLAPHSLTIEEGGVVAYTGGSVGANGSGTVEIAEEVNGGSGFFTGTLSLQPGSRLDLRALPLVPTEEAIPEENRIGWFDPDCEADITYGTGSGKENCVWGLFDHGKKDVEGSLYFHGTFTTGATGDRRPHRIPQARGNGPVRGWMEYSESVADGGNTLRFKTNHALVTQAEFSSVPQGVRTAFVVLDSVNGGGVPVLDTVSGSVIKPRSGANVNDPIWKNGTTGILTNGCTYLDGQLLNGRTKGFSGRPELLSFTTDGSEVPVAFLGYYQSAGSEKSCEIIGESLFFSAILDDATRADIEAYLMSKWFGVCRTGYSDFRGATLTGSGTVIADSPAALPQFAPAFTGSVDLRAESFAFHVDATPAVTDGLSLPASAALFVPESGVIRVTFAQKPVSGSYRLIEGGSIAPGAFADWTLDAVVPDALPGNIQLKQDANGLSVVVIPAGTCIILK
ncbi:MAG: hypothetical protein J6334_05400 [Kiritimatiellae bacterium]|nr:hypothetical protein [Kiritimatiellia bacterium]